MRTFASLLLISLAAAALTGCEEKKRDMATSPAPTAKPTATTTPAPSAKAEATAKAAAAAPTTTGAPAAPPGGPMTVARLQEDFKADEKKWIGQGVKVTGLYLNTNTAKSGDKETYNIVVVDEKGKLRPSLTCTVASKPEGLKQYDEVIVEGTVEKAFGASLKDCAYAKR